MPFTTNTIQLTDEWTEVADGEASVALQVRTGGGVEVYVGEEPAEADNGLFVGNDSPTFSIGSLGGEGVYVRALENGTFGRTATITVLRG